MHCYMVLSNNLSDRVKYIYTASNPVRLINASPGKTSKIVQWITICPSRTVGRHTSVTVNMTQGMLHAIESYVNKRVRKKSKLRKGNSVLV